MTFRTLMVSFALLLPAIPSAQAQLNPARKAPFQAAGGDYGYRLARDGEVELWWCESTYKVTRERAAPKKQTDAVRLEAARGEWEAAQVVLRPRRALHGLSATLSDFTGPKGAVIPASAADLLEVTYVYVAQPTDEQGSVGYWPDPLPPLEEPLQAPGGENQPLWLRVHVPRHAPAGEYQATLSLRAEGWNAEVRVRLRVFDFTLPETLHFIHTQGLISSHLRKYHHLENDEQLRQVFDLYLRNFKEHQVDPYHPWLNNMEVELVGEGDEMRVAVDFSQWDQELERSLDKLGLRAFRFQPEFMPRKGGPGRVGPFEQGSRQYERIVGEYLKLMHDHLKEKGWVDKAIAYWFDEPRPEHYENVRYGMRLLDQYAPEIQRLLTEQPEDELAGSVDIWCPVLHRLAPDAIRRRQEAGDAAWSYVCTGPKAPYAGLFIDHHAIDLRIWQWMAWKWNLRGGLIWRANYWTGGTPYKDKLQNPWEDPQSWRARGGGAWGNGDGRLIYPPRVDPNAPHEPIISGPIDSLRWEMLRDGFEDYEYFYLLREALEDRPDQQAAELLGIPESIVEDAKNFTRHPQPLYEHRRRLAAALERLVD